MKDKNAQSLLARVLGWKTPDPIRSRLPVLQLLADYKYDHYQRFGPGLRFLESLALWLARFELVDRDTALRFVEERLIFISEAEVAHLVQLTYPDVIVSERLRLVSDEQNIPAHRVERLKNHPRFRELKLKSLYLGLSDGAHTNDLRRASLNEISNEQIWQAYELGEAKAENMLGKLRKSLKATTHFSESKVTASDIALAFAANPADADALLSDAVKGALKHPDDDAKFTLIWLIDDFSGSGNTYIRFDSSTGEFDGKIKKVYERLHQGDLIDRHHYEVFLLLYVATRQAIDHIEYWSERFTSERGYAPLRLRVLCPLERDVVIDRNDVSEFTDLLNQPAYYDPHAEDANTAVGRTTDVRFGFAGCGLPVVLYHNTPNNSVYLLWGPDTLEFPGLFPRISRHKES